jgi:tetratricopeptide (TPR) repeat protein
VEQQVAVGEIARLEALVGGDAGASGFPALAEANRRAGRLKEAERVAREGLQLRPELLAGRVALALALLDLGRAEEARAELARVLEHVTDHPMARAAAERIPAEGDAFGEIADDELEQAFSGAEARVDAMVDANDVAAEAMRVAALDAPEGVIAREADSPFATSTVANLLADQGHTDEARALRARAALHGEPVLDDLQRERVIATLERWLDNLRSTR